MLLLTLCPTLGKRFGNTTSAHWPPGPWAAPGPAWGLEVDLRLDAMLGIAIFDIRLHSFTILSVFDSFHRRRRPPSPEKCHLGERDATDHPISRRERRREIFTPTREVGGRSQLRRLRQALMQRRISDQIIRKPLHETCASVRPNARVQVPNESSCCDPAILLGGFFPLRHFIKSLACLLLTWGLHHFWSTIGVSRWRHGQIVRSVTDRLGMEQPQSSKFG